MSGWKVTLREIYEAKKPPTYHDLDDGSSSFGSRLTLLKKQGLAKRFGEGWVLTQKGIDLCEGRITFVRPGPKPSFFKATWLISLPQLSLT